MDDKYKFIDDVISRISQESKKLTVEEMFGQSISSSSSAASQVEPVPKRQTRSSGVSNTKPKVELPAMFKNMTVNQAESSTTFRLYENYPKLFHVDSDNVLTFEGLQYLKKNDKDFRFVARGMECDARYKVMAILFVYKHFIVC